MTRTYSTPFLMELRKKRGGRKRSSAEEKSDGDSEKGMVQVGGSELVGQDGPRRRELDRNFMRTGYRRMLWVSGDPDMDWTSEPRRSRLPLTVTPIPIDDSGAVILRHLDLNGTVRQLETKAGGSYFIPPGVVYQIEARGRGVIEMYTPVTAPHEIFPEEILPQDFFQKLESKKKE